MKSARPAPPVEVTSLAYDNRCVEPGSVFFCVPGFTRDGHDFAADAIADPLDRPFTILR